MKKHKFNNLEVRMLEMRIGLRFKDAMWERFVSISNELGFDVVETGGAFLTHELRGGDDRDFISILELAAGV